MAPRKAEGPLRYESGEILDAGGFVVAETPARKPILRDNFGAAAAAENMRELVRRWNAYETGQAVLHDTVEEQRSQLPIFWFWVEYFTDAQMRRDSPEPTVIEEGNLRALDPDQAVEIALEYVRKSTNRTLREHRQESILNVLRMRNDGIGVLVWDWDDDSRVVELHQIRW